MSSKIFDKTRWSSKLSYCCRFLGFLNSSGNFYFTLGGVRGQRTENEVAQLRCSSFICWKWFCWFSYNDEWPFLLIPSCSYYAIKIPFRQLPTNKSSYSYSSLQFTENFCQKMYWTYLKVYESTFSFRFDFDGWKFS